MDINIILEPKKASEAAEERIIQELEHKAKLRASASQGRLMSLDEILYGADEDIPTLRDVLNDATD